MESPLVLVGWDFRRTPISIRERLAFTPDSTREALARITRQGVLSEGVIVSTCNRSEIYGVGATADVEEAVTEFIAGFHRLPKPEILGSRYGLSGPDAVRHLFRVAAGLESLVLGEDQILGQVREALRGLPTDEGDLSRRVVEIVYADVDPVLWPAAELSVRAQLAYLAR